MKILNYLYIPENNWTLIKHSNDDIKYRKAPKEWILEIRIGTNNPSFILGKIKKVAFILAGNINLFTGLVISIEESPHGYIVKLKEEKYGHRKPKSKRQNKDGGRKREKI